MTIDATDATFQQEVIQKSFEVPVVIDLWAEWCGPCKTLTPILESAVAATDGKVLLAKVDIDANPEVARAFQVQSIPAVFAMRDGQIVDGFMGAQPPHIVEEWIGKLLPSPAETLVTTLIDAGDEVSLRRAVELEPGNADAVTALADLLVKQHQYDEALALVGRVPESDRTRQIAAAARIGSAPADDYDQQLTDLLPQVKADDEARQKFVDLLELMGPDDPRTADYRRRLSAALF